VVHVGDVPGLQGGHEEAEVMAPRIIHGWVNTRERVRSGHRKALCGLVVARRDARRTGATCSMCQAVAANTAASTAASGEGTTRRGGQR
jgi:hypothetical protein